MLGVGLKDGGIKIIIGRFLFLEGLSFRRVSEYISSLFWYNVVGVVREVFYGSTRRRKVFFEDEERWLRRYLSWVLVFKYLVK